MTDKTNNTLVAAMIVIGIIILLILLFRGMSPFAANYRSYQGASAIELLPRGYDRNYRYYYESPRHTETVTSYSRPSRATSFGTTTTTYYTDTSSGYTSYSCQDGYCWTHE